MIVQTPGVYITEKNNLPPSVAGVSTAVPAFIGITEIGQTNPVRIKSMFEFENAFGGGFTPNYTQSTTPDAKVVPNKRFFIYDSLDLYFRNGGGPCYVISAGIYQNTDQFNIASLLTTALDKVDSKDEVTLVTMPDMHFQFDAGVGILGTLAGNGEYSALASGLITKCATLQDKFAILDYLQPKSTPADLRNWISPSGSELKYGALYFPWLNNARSYAVGYDQISLTANSGSAQETALNNLLMDQAAMDAELGGYRTITDLKDQFNILASDVSNKTKLTALFSFLYQLVAGLDSGLVLTDNEVEMYRNSLALNANFTTEVKNLFWFTNSLGSGVSGMLNTFPVAALMPDAVWINRTFSNYADYAALVADSANLSYTPPSSATVAATNSAVLADLVSGNYVNLTPIFTSIANFYEMVDMRRAGLENRLFMEDSVYAQMKADVVDHLKQIPSQGAIAGLYCKNDRERGVWKSPANMAVQGIEKPLFEVSNAEQDGLNVDPVSGKSINVIRTFTGKGALVWGARTLDGNSSEWRYIAVRRFFSFAEESVKKAMETFVFEPNNARTWVKIKAMVTSFLVEQWKAGALVGSTMDESFFVNIGDTTTTSTDILNGIVNVQIGMAVARPAEFIILEFSHQTKA